MEDKRNHPVDPEEERPMDAGANDPGAGAPAPEPAEPEAVSDRMPPAETPSAKSLPEDAASEAEVPETPPQNGRTVIPIPGVEEARMDALIRALFQTPQGETPPGVPPVIQHREETDEESRQNRQSPEPGAAEETENAPPSSDAAQDAGDMQPETGAAAEPAQTPDAKGSSSKRWRDRLRGRRSAARKEPEQTDAAAPNPPKRRQGDEAEEEALSEMLRRLRQPDEDTPEEDLTQTGKLNLRATFDRLVEQSDEYAKTMFEEETQAEEPSPDWADAHRRHLIYDEENGLHWDVPESEEDDEEAFWPERARRRETPRFLRWFRLHEEPDQEELDWEYTPGEMAALYKKGLAQQKNRTLLVGVIAVLLCYTALAQRYLWLFPGGGAGKINAYVGVSLVLTGIAAVLGWRVIVDGILNLFRMKASAELLVSASMLTSILDAGALLIFQLRTESMPFCAVSVVSLLFAMWGRYSKARSRRTAYRMAALSDPYLVTKDSENWEGGTCFTRHLGSVRGFVTQMESEDGVQHMYRPLAPLLLAVSLVFGVLVSVGQSQPNLFLWSVSAMTAASAALPAFFAFTMPYGKLTRRLAGSGSAIGGWPAAAVSGGRNGIALGDRDLFPYGTVEIVGVHLFGGHEEDAVITYTASVLQLSDCGLDKVFHEFLRVKGMLLRRVEDFQSYTSGGYSAVVRNQSVLVGSAAFMREAKIRIPPGQNVKYGVFCAIDGQLAGLFSLKYHSGFGVRGNLVRLVRSRLDLVVATQDFSVSPDMLSRRFKMKEERFAYPPMEERMALSNSKKDYELPLIGLMARDGLSPFAETVVGCRRLRRTVIWGGVFAAVNSFLGVLMTFYLTYVKAFSAISVLHLLVFMLAWLIPGFLIGRSVTRY